MRLFDFRPPPILNVDRSVSESCGSAVSQQLPHAMSNACSYQRDFWRGPWEEKLSGVSHAWRKPVPQQCWPSAEIESNSTWETHWFLRSKEAQNQMFFYTKFVKKDSAEGPTSQKSLASKQRREASGKQPSSPVSRSRKVCRYNPRWSTSTLTFNSS